MLHSNGAEAEDRRLLILPSGVMQLVVNLRDDRFTKIAISGPFFRPFVHDTAKQRSVLLVRFRAGGAAPFLEVPAAELLNQEISLEEVWGPEARHLRDRLIEAPGPAERFNIMEAALLTRMKGVHPAAPFAVDCIASTPRRRIRELIKTSGLSERQFQRVFSESVGLTAKQYQRIRRFQDVLARLESLRAPNWLDIAFDAGYFDQAHFVHEFAELSGMTPGEYMIRKGEHLNHVPIRDVRPPR